LKKIKNKVTEKNIKRFYSQNFFEKQNFKMNNHNKRAAKLKLFKKNLKTSLTNIRMKQKKGVKKKFLFVQKCIEKRVNIYKVIFGFVFYLL
jgi:hypothetical protein